jgi:hypothetical protein
MNCRRERQRGKVESERSIGGIKMSRTAGIIALVSLGSLALAAAPARSQGFGSTKEKITLQRKLPAIIHLPGDTIKVSVTTADEDGALPYDFQALLETELLKDQPSLRIDDSPAVFINCQITEYSHPDPVYTSRGMQGSTGSTIGDIVNGAAKATSTERITGEMYVSFQAKTPDGKMLISDNVSSNYDHEFDAQGNSAEHGVFGSVTGTIGRAKGGKKSQDINAPTPAELRSLLITEVVQQIAEHVVNSDEKVDVFLAQKPGPLDEGNKQAEAGLWERALETWETATPFPKPDEDAYRLYNVGVAYEALAYQADDEKTAMKFLDQASVNYGKAADAKPTEKYFVEPQKRIETAITHYKQLDEEAAREKAAAAAAAQAANNKPASPAQASTGPKGLTNSQVIGMVKNGMADDTIILAIRGAKAVSFDLTADGLADLKNNGVSTPVVTAMKTRAARKAPSTTAKPATTPKPTASK